MTFIVRSSTLRHNRVRDFLYVRILLVEDESRVAGFIAKGLREQAYAVDIVRAMESTHFYCASVKRLRPRDPGRQVLPIKKAAIPFAASFALRDRARPSLC